MSKRETKDDLIEHLKEQLRKEQQRNEKLRDALLEFLGLDNVRNSFDDLCVRMDSLENTVEDMSHEQE